MKVTFLNPPSQPVKSRAPDRNFGCVVGNSILIANPKAAAIDSLKSGDKVLTHSGKYKKVLARSVRHIKEDLVKIRATYSNEETLITREHPVLIFNNGKLEWVDAGNLKKGDFLTFPINRDIIDKEYIDLWEEVGEKIQKNANRNISLDNNRIKYYKDIPRKIEINAKFMKLAGYYLAEAANSLRENKGGEIIFCFHTKEKELHKEVLELMDSIFNLKGTVKTKGNSTTIHFNSRVVAELFKKLFGVGAKNKSLPMWVLYSTLEKQKELIKAFWLGDGSKDKYSYEFTTASQILALQIKQILLRFDIFGSFDKTTAKDGRIWYRIRPSGENIIKLNKLLDVEHTYKPHKHRNLGKIYENYFVFPVRKVETIPFEGEVFNVEVENDNSYVLKDFIVHNCNYGVAFQEPSHILYPAAILENA